MANFMLTLSPWRTMRGCRRCKYSLLTMLSPQCSAKRIVTRIGAAQRRLFRPSRPVAVAVCCGQQVARRVLLAELAGTALVCWTVPASADMLTAGITIQDDEPGFGTRPAQPGDLLLLHYVGKLQGTEQVFDSTRGGLLYRDGGLGVMRPIILRLGGGPVPGVCAGLQQGVRGMRVGGRRTFVVPPELGFSTSVNAPYATVPLGSSLQYEVELIRLSTRGPDDLTRGVERCGQGGAAQQVAKCADIQPAEFL
ncbi:hypothetical protein V8C86DRAFT_2863006 [Haematococcus lacustris]